jgi:hypothetical protein
MAAQKLELSSNVARSAPVWAATSARAVAIDGTRPGVGGSTTLTTDGSGPAMGKPLWSTWPSFLI